MKNTFKILFWVNKKKENTKGLAPIYCRITVNGKRAEIATHHYIFPNKWDIKGKRVKGVKGASINESLDQMKNKIRIERDRLMGEGRSISSDDIKYLVSNPNSKCVGLINATEQYINYIRERIGKGFSKGHYSNFITTFNYLKLFLKKTRGTQEILLTSIEPKFITDFEVWILQNSDCAKNGMLKNLQRLKRIIHYSMENGWLPTDPFKYYSLYFDAVERSYLTIEEINTIQKKDYSDLTRLQTVKDLFIFSCFTGLSFKDALNLKSNQIENRGGINWITGLRGKTQKEFFLPLLPPAQEILNRYKSHPLIENTESVLPQLSNQKFNSYLKEIADGCGIHKNLHHHLARHSFATTICANYGLPVETAQRALGHTKITTTMHYYKLTNEKISGDWSKVFDKLPQQREQEPAMV